MYRQMQKGVQVNVSTTPSLVNDGKQGDICNRLQRQNDINALLVLSPTWPPSNIPVRDGDPLQYEVFIRALWWKKV